MAECRNHERRRRISPVGKKPVLDCPVHAETGYDCVVKLLRSELVYDIDFISWKVAKCRVSENAEAQAEAQTDGESTNWLNRQIETAVDNVKSELGIYVNEPCMRVQTDHVESEEEWTIVLRMESGWRGNVKNLKTYIHGYVVNYVLAYWFEMTLPDEAGKYHVLSEQMLRKVVLMSRNVVATDVKFLL